MSTPRVIGLVSDTHGLVRPALHRALAGVDCILHAGDVCGDAVLDELALIAPVYAVAGNCDPPGDPRLPLAIDRRFGDRLVHVSHGHELGAPTPDKLLKAYAADILIFGHTHRPVIHRAGDRLVVNPGAAGPRRFELTPTVARLTLDPDGAHAALVDLDD